MRFPSGRYSASSSTFEENSLFRMWSKDGQYIVLNSDRGGMWPSTVESASGRRAYRAETTIRITGPCPDRRRLAYVEETRGENEGICVRTSMDKRKYARAREHV
jgi:hypothetical protein